MGIGLTIILGAMTGLAFSKLRGSGFGAWWDIYLGVTGSAYAACISILAYIINLIPNQQRMDINGLSIIINISGSLTFMYLALLFKRLKHHYNQPAHIFEVRALG